MNRFIVAYRRCRKDRQRMKSATYSMYRSTAVRPRVYVLGDIMIYVFDHYMIVSQTTITTYDDVKLL